MDFLSNLNCPQYVDFESEILKDAIITNGLEVSSCSSIKDVESENMDAEDENVHSQDNQSTISEPYLDNSSYQENTESVASTSQETVDFPVNYPTDLSENASQNNSKVNKTTKVQPFHFMESRKRKRDNSENEYIPLAEQVIAFHKKTPQRFHTTGSKVYEPMEQWSAPVIQPKSPNLRTVKRLRGVNVPSREELEEKEVEEMKKYKFRARPVNQKVLRHCRLPIVGKKKATKPKEIHLRTAQRAKEVHANKNVEEKPYEFHARPVPKAVLTKPEVPKSKLSLPVTQAKTPNFALKSRAEKWKSENKLNITSLEIPKFKALPAPPPTSPFTVKHEKKHTEIQPFSFESRDKEMLTHKEQKILEQLEKENSVYVFHAQPMPSPTPSSLPVVEKKPPTVPQPFNIHLESGSFKHSSFSSPVCPPPFKAQPAKVLEKPPFIPEKSAKEPTEVQEFMLYTDVRALERQKLKEINDLKEQEREIALQRLKELQEEEERQEIAKLRKEIVHKANPIRHYKSVEIKPSSRPPTNPVSPKFKTEERLQMRH